MQPTAGQAVHPVKPVNGHDCVNAIHGGSCRAVNCHDRAQRSPANLAVRPVESGLLSTVKSAALTRAVKEQMGLINRVNTVSILINGD